MFRILIVAITLLCYGCATTMVPLDRFTPSRIVAEVKVGERVIIDATNGQRYDLTVTMIQNDALFGTTKAGKRYKMPYESIDRIEVERHSGWEAGVPVMVLGTAAVIGFIWALIRGLQFESGPDYGND